MAIGSSIGGALGTAVGSLYGPLGSALGSALGAAAGAGLEAIPGLIETDAEKENKRRLAQLNRMQEMGTLGLTENEKQSMYTSQQSQISNQLKQGQQVARQAGAAGMQTGAGGENIRAMQAAESNAALAADAARAVGVQDLQRKRELEDELQSRIAAKSQYDTQRLQSGLGVASAGLAAGMEQSALETTIQGKKPSAAEIQSFASTYNIPAENAGGFLEMVSKRPEMLKYLSVLENKQAPVAATPSGAAK